MIVTLLGATGLVGNECRKILEKADFVERLILPVRRMPGGAISGAKAEWTLIDFSKLQERKDLFTADAVICCLGTTIKKAGNKKNFEAVDLKLPLACAGIAKAQGAKHFLVLSAQGANPSSPFHYNRTKGLLEQGLGLLGFPSLTVVRPSLLLGKRTERRPLESLMQKVFSRNLNFIPAFWRPVHAEAVAQVLASSLLEPPQGMRIIYNRSLAKMDIVISLSAK